jgi:hypothetical protein
MSAPPSHPASPQSAMRRPKDDPTPLPMDPSAPPKIGTSPRNAQSHSCLGTIIDWIAILSVYDKTGLLDLAKNLTKRNVKLYGSGGTAGMVREAGFPIGYVFLSTEQIC